MKRIDAIAFDLDHTLYDRNETWSALTASFMRVFETSLSGEQLLRSLRRADYESTYEESSWRGMLQKLQRWGVVKPDVPFETFDAFIRTYFPDAIVPYKDTYRVLDWCREMGFAPSLITNGHTGLQERKLTAMPLEDAFSVCIICNLDDGSPCKPSPEPFLELAARLKLPPERILYVGDNPVNDIAGASGCGMQTAWLSVMDNWKTGVPAPTFEISRLSDLPALVAGS